MTSILKVSEIQDPTNSNSALTIDTNGQVVLTAIPYARLEVTGTPSTTIGSNSYGVVPYNSVLGSRGITHNTSTFNFQVPVTGLYNLQGGLRWNNASTYLWWRVAQADGTLVQNVITIATASGSGFITAFGSILLPLEASTDYRFEFADGSTNSTKVVQGGQSYMCIHLIGGV